jgi:hypothetical protein
MCSHCKMRPAAPDRRQCQRCLDTQARRRERRRNPSVKDLDSAIRLLRKQGRSIIRARPRRKTIIVMSPRELDLLVKYAAKFGR